MFRSVSFAEPLLQHRRPHRQRSHDLSGTLRICATLRLDGLVATTMITLESEGQCRGPWRVAPAIGLALITLAACTSRSTERQRQSPSSTSSTAPAKPAGGASSTVNSSPPASAPVTLSTSPAAVIAKSKPKPLAPSPTDECHSRCKAQEADCEAAQRACPPGAPCMQRACRADRFGCDARCGDRPTVPR